MAIVLAWGLAVMIAIYAVGRISGAHLNPAVTLALVITGSFPIEQMIGYILAQVAGVYRRRAGLDILSAALGAYQ